MSETSSTSNSELDNAFAAYEAKLNVESVFDEPVATVPEGNVDQAFAAYETKLKLQTPDVAPTPEDDPVEFLDEGVRTTLSESMDKNPDMMSQIYDESEETGVPVPFAEKDIENLNKQKQIGKINPSKNPALARFLTSRRNSDVAHDDIEVLTEIEDHVKAYAGGLISFPQMIVGGTAAGIEAGTRLLDKALPDEWADAINSVDLGFVEDFTPAKLLRMEETELKEIADDIKPTGTGTSVQVAAALGQVTAQIGTMLLAPQTAFPSLFAQNIAQQEQRQIKSKAEHTAVADIALITSGGLAVIERFGLEKLLNRVPVQVKNRIAQKLTDVVIGGGYEAATEVLENLGHSLVEYISTNPDADFTKGIIQEAKVGGITGAIVRALIPSYKGRGVNDAQADQERVENKTQAEQEHIDGLVSLLQKGKLATRDPKALKRFIDELPADTEFKISSEAFHDFEGEIPVFVQEQLDVVGTDVIMTVDQLASEVVNNPELLAAVRPHMRMSDETLTQAEMAAGGMTTVDNLMRDAAENAEIESEADQVTKDVVDQLVATGRLDSNNAKHAAAVIESYVVTKAKELGISVKEVFDKMNLTIKPMGKHDFGDAETSRELTLEETGQKVKVREKTQILYDRKLKQQDMITKLRDCINV